MENKGQDDTVKPQWLKHLWDHGNLFETWVVRATEGLIMASGREAKGDNLGKSFDLLHSNCMLGVLIRIALMRHF